MSSTDWWAELAAHSKRGLSAFGRAPWGRARRDPDAAADLRDAKAVFARVVALEQAYDPGLADHYADDGLVIERSVFDGQERPPREIPMARYKAALPEALALAQRAGERAEHQEVKARRIAPGWVQVRSQRWSSQSLAAGAYEVTLRRFPDGAWRIVKEMATLIR